VRHHTIQIN